MSDQDFCPTCGVRRGRPHLTWAERQSRELLQRLDAAFSQRTSDPRTTRFAGWN